MKISLRNIVITFAALLCSTFVLQSGLAYAANPAYAGVDCAGVAAGSPVCHASTSDPLTGNNGIIVKATNLIALVAGAVAVIMIIIGGIKLITSNGEASSIAEARKTIIYALIGIVVIVLAKTIITFVVSRV